MDQMQAFHHASTLPDEHDLDKKRSNSMVPGYASEDRHSPTFLNSAKVEKTSPPRSLNRVNFSDCPGTQLSDKKMLTSEMSAEKKDKSKSLNTIEEYDKDALKNSLIQYKEDLDKLFLKKIARKKSVARIQTLMHDVEQMNINKKNQQKQYDPLSIEESKK